MFLSLLGTLSCALFFEAKVLSRLKDQRDFLSLSYSSQNDRLVTFQSYQQVKPYIRVLQISEALKAELDKNLELIHSSRLFDKIMEDQKNLEKET